MTRVCVFCGSRDGARPGYLKAARELGEAIATRGCGLVYGGAAVGLMGALADAALAAGGEVTGVFPRFFDQVEVAHKRLTTLEVVDDLLARKKRMAELADGFIALPGGGGTLDELFEMFTWSQLGLHHKPIVLYGVDGYWRHLEQWIDHAIAEGFIDSHQRRYAVSASGAAEAVELALKP